MFSLLLFDELANELFLVYLVLDLRGVLPDFLLHDEHGLMGPVLNKLIFDILVHHIEPIFNVVLCPTRHFFNDLGPLVADRQALLENKDVFSEAERVLLDLWVQEVDPPFSALFTVSVGAKILVKLLRDLTPLFGTVLANQFDQLLIFTLHPITLLDGRFLILVELVLALRVVTARDEASDLDPVILVKLLRSDSFTSTVFLDGPLQKLRLIVNPVLFRVICLFALEFCKLVEYLRGRLVVNRLLGGVDGLAGSLFRLLMLILLVIFITRSYRVYN